ncbi:MAG: hypothetical protein ACOH5I_25675 [Oligoflexus sp.]
MAADGTVLFPGVEWSILTKTDNLPTEWFTIYDGNQPNRDPFTTIFFYLEGVTGSLIKTFGVRDVSPAIFQGGQVKSRVYQVIWEVDGVPGVGLYVEIAGEFEVPPPPLVIESAD